MKPVRRLGTDRVHAMQYGGKALCGVKADMSRATWVFMAEGTEVTCPRCVTALRYVNMTHEDYAAEMADALSY